MAIFHVPNVPLGRATKKLLEEMIQKDQDAGGMGFQVSDLGVDSDFFSGGWGRAKRAPRIRAGGSRCSTPATQPKTKLRWNTSRPPVVTRWLDHL